MVAQRNKSRRPQKKKGRESIRYHDEGLPLSGTRHTYIGKGHEWMTPGEVYTVIDTGAHWWDFCGVGAWFTTDEYPDTTDIDYGVFYPTAMCQTDFRPEYR